MVGHVVVVGSLNVDLVVGVDRFPAAGETLIGHSVEQHPGGKGLNQAVAAARLGARVEMVGSVGTDAGGAWLRSVVADEGLGSSALTESVGSSGTALIEIDATGANRIVVVPGANGTLSAEHVADAIASFDDVAVVLVQCEIPPAAVAAALRSGRTAGAITILNPAPAAAFAAELLAEVDYVVPNEHEAALLTGMDASTHAGATEAAHELVRRGAGAAVITRGAAGAVWVTDESRGSQGAFSVTSIDTVAAGDAFCGGFATALAAGLTLEEALLWASAAGALATTVAGAVPSLPDRTAVEALLAAES